MYPPYLKYYKFFQFSRFSYTKRFINLLDGFFSRAGYKVTVIDMSDHDWWKGKCLGKVGFFPSKYVTRLQPGERVLQVTHNLQVAAADNSDKVLTLLRDQVSHFPVGEVQQRLDKMLFSFY